MTCDQLGIEPDDEPTLILVDGLSALTDEAAEGVRSGDMDRRVQRVEGRR